MSSWMIVSYGNACGLVYGLLSLGWHAPNRDLNTGAPMANPNRFSKGIKHLSDAVRALGFEFGIWGVVLMNDKS